MTPLTIEAPTDAQLAYIAALCTQHEMPLPDAVASKVEASRIIEELKSWQYDPANYAYPFAWQEDVPF